MEAFGEEDLRVAKIYLLIGKLQMKEKDYVEAVSSLNEALVIYLGQPEGCKSAISSCYAKLAESYLHIERYDEALVNFESLLGVNQPEEENPLLSHYYVNFAIALAYAKHKYDEALLYLQNCLKREMALNGESSLSSGNCYLKIGQINTMQGRYKEAMEHYQKALEISKLIGGNTHRQTGSCYNAIGAVFLGQGKYNEAIEYFRMALNCFEEKDFEIYACYKNIAMTCFRQKKYDSALMNFEHSIEERSKMLEGFSEADAECAALHGFLASLYVRNMNYGDGLEHYQQFLEIFFKMFCIQAAQAKEAGENSG
jgi:tetratricopeptide (TPR) repeat protein